MPEIAKFIQNTPNNQLKVYFLKQGIDLTLSTHAANDDHLTALLTAVDQLDDEQKVLLRLDAERINKMSDQLGLAAFISVFEEHDILYRLENGHARSAWMFINQKQLFRQAEEVRYADQYHEGKRWDGFEGPKNLTVFNDPMHLEKFQNAFKDAYPTTEDMHIDVFARTRTHIDRDPSHLYQLSIYRDDLAINKLTFE